MTTPTALEPIRFSRLKLMGKSPAHFAAGYSGEESSPMRKGTALHSYLLGGRGVVVYEGRRDNRMQVWQEFQAAHAGEVILSPKELGSVHGMRKSIERHQRAMDLLDDGVQEQRITWDIGGRACAGTPDVVKPMQGRKRLVELKTSRTAAPFLFKHQARNMAYHAQVAWYEEGCNRTMAYAPGPVDEVYIVVVEATAPYPVTVLRVRESILQRGRQQWRLWFEAARNCEHSGHFPAYVESDVDWEDEEAEADGLDWSDAAE